jgi:hypothetical protein
MDNESLTFSGLVMGGRSLHGRQDHIFGGKHHGGALVKTDESKRRIVGFGGKVLTNKKSPPLFLRSIFILTHHFLCFCLFFLFVPTDVVGKCCGRRLGGQ